MGSYFPHYRRFWVLSGQLFGTQTLINFVAKKARHTQQKRTPLVRRVLKGYQKYRFGQVTHENMPKKVYKWLGDLETTFRLVFFFKPIYTRMQVKFMVREREKKRYPRLCGSSSILYWYPRKIMLKNTTH